MMLNEFDNYNFFNMKEFRSFTKELTEEVNLIILYILADKRVPDN